MNMSDANVSYNPETLQASPEITEAEEIQINKVVIKAAGDTASALKQIVADAKNGDPRAMKKLEAFDRYSDPQLAARVAMMNRSQRRAFEAARRGKNKSGSRG